MVIVPPGPGGLMCTVLGNSSVNLTIEPPSVYYRPNYIVQYYVVWYVSTVAGQPSGTNVTVPSSETSKTNFICLAVISLSLLLSVIF